MNSDIARALFVYQKRILWILISFCTLYLPGSYRNNKHIVVLQTLISLSIFARSREIVAPQIFPTTENDIIKTNKLIPSYSRMYLLIVTLMLNKDDVINHLRQYQEDERAKV